MAFSTYHQFLSLQASQANANLAMFEAMQRSGQLALPAPSMDPPAPPQPLAMLLLGDVEVEQIIPECLPTNVFCRTVGSRYRHLVSALRSTPDLCSDVANADCIVLAYGRDDLSRQVPTRRGAMPIPSRMIAEEAVEAILELRSTSPKSDLQVFCMEALPLSTWDEERSLAAGMLIDQVAVAPCCNGVITSAWCPDAFIQMSGHLTPQGYKAFAQQLHTLMWHVQGCPAW